MKHNAATVALRLLLDACNDENDEEVQEALDRLSDEIERGHWPQARAAVTGFLDACTVADEEEAVLRPEDDDPHDAEDWGSDDDR